MRGRIESILNWATVREYRAGDNPARWRGHLEETLSTVSKRPRHHPALPYADLPAFMGELRARASNSASALEFAILTAARTGEAIGATWDEISIDTKIWTIPAGRMKGEREHRVPLSDRAIKVLTALPRKKGVDPVFAGEKPGKPLSNMAMLELLRGMRPNGYTVHGFRSSFRDWCSERTAYPREVCEMALAHTIESDVEAAYRRGDLLEKRRRLMADWAKYCGGATSEGAKVVPLRGRAKQ